MADEPGFKIDGEVFPIVQRYKKGDPILIYELTGWDWDEFAERLTQQLEPGAKPDPTVQTALLAIAVQRRFSTWSRKRVVQYVTNLDFDAEEIVGGGAEEAPQESPPAQPGSGANSSNSGEASNTPPDSNDTSASQVGSTVSSPTSSGVHGSVTSTPALRQIA